MKLYLNDNSVCELMYIMRDAVLSDKLTTALCVCGSIHTKLEQLIERKQELQCKLDCEKKD